MSDVSTAPSRAQRNPGNHRQATRVRPVVKFNRKLVPALALGMALGFIAQAQEFPVRNSHPPVESGRMTHWAVVLDQEPVAAHVRSRAELRSTRALAVREQIERAQDRLRLMMGAMRGNLRETGAVQVLMNAVFVQGTPEDALDLATLPGVRDIFPLHAIRPAGTRAIGLVRAPEAWDYGGGLDNAGKGVFIGIIDSGVDHTHPAMQDGSLDEVPRRCTGGECDYTNRKVIAARSYVNMIAFPDEPEYSRPDDLSPRDRMGHGTAVAMLAGGARHESPLGTISGVAPKAFIGNYKVFGSPGVNDITFGDAVMKALEDALDDGMDIVALPLQYPAGFGPLDTAPEWCGGTAGRPCDALAEYVHRITRFGMSVVTAAGNDGDLGLFLPGNGSITSPGTAPGAITAGATSNAHQLSQSLRISGGDTPEGLRQIRGLLGNGPHPAAPITAPVRDVRRLDDDGKACSALPSGSLRDAIALVEAQDCSSRTKVNYAARAGARAVVMMRGAGQNSLVPPDGLLNTAIPLLLIGHDDGVALRTFLEEKDDREGSLDPAVVEVNDPDGAKIVDPISSKGPAISTYETKPDVVAPGMDLYVATQRFDPAGDLYNPSGYTVVNGTSFATGLVAGSAAMARQTLPGLRSFPESERAPILKSSVVNTANLDVSDYNSSMSLIDAPLNSMGNGFVDTREAMAAPITVNPSAVNYGVVNRANLPVVRTLVFTNHLDRQVTVNLRVQAWTNDSVARVELGRTSFSLGAGSKSEPIEVRLAGARPLPGVYEGIVIAEVDGVTGRFNIPFLYLSGDGIPYNILPVQNQSFSGIAGRSLLGPLLCKVVDRYHVPVANLPVNWSVLYGGGEVVRTFTNSSGVSITDINGVAEATEVRLGEQLGEQAFQMSIRDFPMAPFQFVGNARLQPVIESGGIVNAASGQGPIAPGSVISFFGRGLSEGTLTAAGPGFPLSLAGVSVSFDDTGRGISLPGRMVYVSDNRVDVQVPWELSGVPAIDTKVSINANYSSPVVNVPIAAVSPAFWRVEDPETGQLFVDARDESGARITNANRARRGQLIRVYANGLGPVDSPPPAGEPAPGDGVIRVTGTVRIKIGEREITPEFSGLAPGTTGNYEVRLRLPIDLVTGTQDIFVVVNGVSSPAARLPVEN